MRVEVARTSEALLAPQRVAVQVSVLSLINTTSMCFCLWLSFSFLCCLDVLEESVVLGEVGKDVSFLYKVVSSVEASCRKAQTHRDLDRCREQA